MNIENPRTNKFRVEFKSTNCKLDNPTAAIVPNITQYTPPTMGWGIVRKMALNLQTIPIKSMKILPNWTTLRLPTLVIPIAPMFSE